jgi:Cu/Ag efflux protein CusF
MRMKRAFPLLTALAILTAAPVFPASGQTTPSQADHKGKKEFAYRGKVEAVDKKAKTLSVNGENVQGWMMAMTMTYHADKDDVVNNVKVGDQITAKVYEGDFKTLYDVKIVAPAKGKEPSEKK